MSAPRIAVVGGGLAGLSAAVQLTRVGAIVELFEAASSVGGVVQGIHRDGWIIDRGPCMAAEPGPGVRELLDHAGVADVTVRATPESGARVILRDGVPVALPRSASEFTSSPLLSLGGRLRLLKERFVPASSGGADETADAFARRRFGDEMADRMFDPLIASTSAGDPQQLLARHAFPALVGHEVRTGSGLAGSARDRMQARRRAKGAPRGSWSCAGGMQQLPGMLAAAAGTVQCSSRVMAVQCGGGQVTVRVNDTTSTFDAVVLACPPAAFRQIDFAGVATTLAPVADLPTFSIGVLSFGFRVNQVNRPISGARLLIPSLERTSLLSAVIPTNAFPGRAPAGHMLCTGFIGGARSGDLLHTAPGAIVRRVLEEVRTMFAIAGEPIVTDIAIWTDALPQAIAGHDQRIAAADAVEASASRIAFAGSWRDGLSIGEVIAGGMAAADRLLARLAQVDSP